MESVIHLLSELVAIPSMNPMGRTKIGDEYSEKAIAEHIAQLLKAHAIDTQVIEVLPGRPNVIGRIDVKAPQTLLLEAHLDTVHADAMSIAPFDPVIRDGKLFGRGACDTKGAIAALLQAVIDVLAINGQFKYNLVLLFVCDEEYRFSGAMAACDQLQADFGIVGEPTQLSIVRAHKGVTRWKIHTTGIAAHSAYPERGSNAIYAMANVVKRIEEYAQRLHMRRPHPLLGSPTISVGVIEGGEAVNIVPDRCSIEIDRRTVPGETTGDVFEAALAGLQGLPDWHADLPYLSVAGMELAEEAGIVRLLSEPIRRVTGSVSLETAHYATDAGFYNNFGIPSVVFGPGNIAQAHTTDEHISLDQVEQAKEIIKGLITV
ncbi:MAG: M20 family metallopeptidase [bacterium]